MSRRVLVCLLVVAVSGCFNRAPVRFHGVATDFPPASTGFRAPREQPRALRVAPPTDARAAHDREKVGGTGWTGCKTDPFEGAAPQVLATEIARELEATGIFQRVAEGADPGALVLDTEMRAFCSQVIGFLYLRVAGIVSLRFTLRDGERVLYERTLEKVVTDADEEYSGSQVAFIEEAMKTTLSDSLRTVLYKLALDLDGLDALRPKPL